jgi:nucleotide-binding universal stress UspA family protein
VERCVVQSTKIKPERKEFEMNAAIETSIDAEVATAQPVDIPNFTFSHILAPTDFSPNSARAVDYAVQLARRLGAKLTLVHIVPEPSALDYPIEGIPIQEIEGWEEEAEKSMADQLARAKLQYQEVDSVQRTALHPRDEIIRVAKELSADLLVISTHGYTGWRRFLFGSDAEKIFEHACCPTLVVRSEGTIGGR